MIEQAISWATVAILVGIVAYLVRRNTRHREARKQLQREIDALTARNQTEDKVRKKSPDDRRRALDEWMRGED